MKSLSAAAIRHYHEHGYYAPVRALSTAEAAEVRRHLEQYEHVDGTLSGPLRHKTHLVFTWLNELIRHPGILDAVEDLIGPNILCWGTSFFIKEARNPSYVSWHQDSTYWGLEPPDIVTAWVAISESTLENGAMRVIPGTHKGEQMGHRDTFAPDNLLSRGQEIAVDVDGSKAVDLVLRPGEMSLHHVRLIHGSEQSLRAAPHWLRHPVPAHPCPPDGGGARLRHFGARCGHLSQFRRRAAPRHRYVCRRARI